MDIFKSRFQTSSFFFERHVNPDRLGLLKGLLYHVDQVSRPKRVSCSNGTPISTHRRLTRTSSAQITSSAGDAMCSSTSAHNTRSKLESGNSSRAASPATAVTLGCAISSKMKSSATTCLTLSVRETDRKPSRAPTSIADSRPRGTISMRLAMRCRSRGLLRASARSIRPSSDTSPTPERRPEDSVKELLGLAYASTRRRRTP